MISISSNHPLNRTEQFHAGTFNESEFGGLIFDCDGTLTDSMPLHFEAWSKVMTRHNLEFGIDRFYAMGGMPTRLIVNMLSEEQGVPTDAELVSVEKEQQFMTLLDRLEPIESVCELAKRNLGRQPISVASGGERELVVAQLERIKLQDLFEVLVCAEDTELHKPEPDVFLKAAELMGSIPNQCCVFEDSPLGFQAAVSAGMAFVDVRPAEFRTNSE